MKKMFVSLSVITLLVKVFGLVKELLLSYYYGASGITDAYVIAMTIPGIIFTFIGLAITTSYIPIYMKIKSENKSNDVINNFTSNLINCMLVITSVLIVITLFFSKEIVSVIAYGFDDNMIELSSLFTRINIFGISFIGIIYIFNGYLQSNDSFVINSLVQIPYHIISIIFIVLSSLFTVKLLILGNVIALFFQMLILVISASKFGFKYQRNLNFKDSNIIQTYRMAIPLFFGVSVNQLNTLVDKSLASNIVVGGISALNYANKLNLFVYGTVVVVVTTIIFPTISRLVSQNKSEEACDEVLKAVNFIAFLVLPATAGAMIFSREIVQLVFMRGSFDIVAVDLTSKALFFYSIGITFTGIKEIVVRYYYSNNNTKKPTLNSIFAVVMNIILNVILSKYMGISGLALATSMAAIISSMLLFYDFFKTNRVSLTATHMKELVKIIMSTISMAIFGRLMYTSLVHLLSDNMSLLITIPVSILVYLLLAYIFKVSEIDDIKKLVFRKNN